MDRSQETGADKTVLSMRVLREPRPGLWQTAWSEKPKELLREARFARLRECAVVVLERAASLRRVRETIGVGQGRWLSLVELGEDMQARSQVKENRGWQGQGKERAWLKCVSVEKGVGSNG